MNPSPAQEGHDADPTEPIEPPKSSRAVLFTLLAILAVVLIAAGVTLFVMLGDDDPTETAAISSAGPTETAAPGPSDSGSSSPTATPTPSDDAATADDPAPADDPPATAGPAGLDETNAIWTEDASAWTPFPGPDWDCLDVNGNRYMSSSTNCVYGVADGHDGFYAVGMFANDTIEVDPADLPGVAMRVVEDWIQTDFSDASGLAVEDLAGDWTRMDGELAAIATGRAVWDDTNPIPYDHEDVVVVMSQIDGDSFLIGIGSAPGTYPGGRTDLQDKLLATDFV